MYVILFLALHCLRTDGVIISVIETCRHGARAPIDDYSWDTGYWSQGYGELTQEGMRQQYLNGMEFRRRYITEQQVLPPSFNHSLLYVRSTDLNRTIMTAESQLVGLYPVGPSLSSVAMESKAVPPFNVSNLTNILAGLGTQALPNYFQPIPVHVVNQDYDHMLRGYAGATCPYINVIALEVQQSNYYQYLVDNYTEYLQKRVQQVFQQDVDFTDAGWFGDAIICERFHGYPMPQGVTEEMYQQMIGIMNYSNSYFFQNGGAYLSSSEFFGNLLEVFEGSINGTGTLKWGLYCAHDTTLIGFLYALGQWTGLNPPFASTLVFELHEENGEYFVQTIYNDELLSINGCEIMCPYSQFSAFLLSWIIPDIEQACQIPADFDIELVAYNPFLHRVT